MKRFKKGTSLLLIAAIVVTSLSVGFGFSSGALTYAGSWSFYAKTKDFALFDFTTWTGGTNDPVVIKMWSGAGGTGTLLYTSQDLGEPVRSPGSGGSLSATDVPTTNQIASITFNKVSGFDSWYCETVTVYYTPIGGSQQQIGTISPNSNYTDNNSHLICNTTFFTSDHNRYITFDANGGSGTMTPQYLVWGTSDYLKANAFSKTGYNLLGWASSQAGADTGIIDYAGGANFTMPDSNPTLYAVWTTSSVSPYTVYHYKQNIEKTAFDILAFTDHITGITGSTVTAADKYYTGFTAVTPLANGIVSGDGSLVLTQNYTRNSYLIQFDANGGAGGFVSSMVYQAPLTAPAVSKNGYTFTGWSPAVPSTVPAETKIYTAQWSANTYTIEYDGNGATGGSTASSLHTYDTPQALTLNGFSRTAYKFIGWSASPTDPLPTYLDGESVENLTAEDGATVKLYAIWIDENSYIITFDDNGGEGGTINTLVAGEPLNAPPVTRTGYTLDGWDPVKPETVPAEDTIYTAQWKINQYTLNFNEAGGSPVPDITQDYGTAIIAPADPVREGYTFDGWIPGVPSTIPAENTTCTAQWKANSYNITFDDAGGEGGTGPSLLEYGSVLTAPEVTREGYTFDGWNPAVPGTVPAADTTYTAQWKINQYTISFDETGGSPVPDITQDYGTTIAAPADPARDGYTFNGWLPVVPSTMPAESITCTAQWTINQYSVSFDEAGGSAVPDITQNFGTTIITPNDPVREGYTFNGWIPDVPSTMPAESITCTAQWTINQYSVSFDEAGGSPVPDISQDFGTAITAPADPSREGYTFDGWTPDVPSTMPAENITCIAQWLINQYTITFDEAGGSAVPDITQNFGTIIITPDDPVREGYTFNGWIPGVPSTMPAESITCTAQWTINQYSVNFDEAGGSPVQDISQDYGTAITAPADPVREGYTFEGWTPGVPSTMSAENITCIAQWSINSYTITFDTAGGSAVAPITQDYGTVVSAPADPAKDGFIFNGWDPAVPGTIPGTDITCVAMWKINQYTITFDSAGGSTVAPITQDVGTVVTSPANPTRPGYAFNGWNPAVPSTMPESDITCVAQWTIKNYRITFNAGGGTGGTGPTLMEFGSALTTPAVTREGYTFDSWYPEVPGTVPAADITYTAQWNINKYTISFDEAGGSAVPDITQNYGTTVTAPADPAREGYTFNGWAPGVPSTMPAENITCTAQWTANSFTITFDAGGGEGGEVQTVAYGITPTPPEVTKLGCTFTGWNPEVAAVTGNETYVAQWVAIEYTITFDANGGEGGDIQLATYGTIPTPPTVTRSGYAFAGWSPAVETVTGDATYTAQWLMLGDINFDGKINVVDARLALQKASGLIILTSAQLMACDVNQDGKYNVVDARFILQYASGLITNFQ